jgi:hypothetical protein
LVALTFPQMVQSALNKIYCKTHLQDTTTPKSRQSLVLMYCVKYVAAKAMLVVLLPDLRK